MASFNQVLALDNFVRAIVVPLFDRLADRRPGQVQSAQDELLLYNSLLWLSLGATIGYFEPSDASKLGQRLLEPKRFSTFVTRYRSTIAIPGLEWLEGIADDIRRPDRRRYDNASGGVHEAMCAHFQSALLLYGRCIAAEDAIASELAAAVMHASSEQWRELSAKGLTGGSHDDRFRFADDALDILRYIDACLRCGNHVAQDSRFDELIQHQFTSDLAIVWSWPINLEAQGPRDRFRAFMSRVLSLVDEDLKLDSRSSRTLVSEVERLTTEWGQFASQQVAAGAF